MAVAHGGTGTAAESTGASSLTVALSGLTGSDLIVCVGVFYTGSSGNITGIDYQTGGTTEALTELDEANNTINCNVASWYLVGPDTSNTEIEVSFGSSVRCGANAVYYTGVDQTNPWGSTIRKTVATGSSTDTTANITMASTDEMIFAAAGWHLTQAGTPGSGTTERWDEAVGAGGGSSQYLGGDEVGANGSVTVNWTHADTRTWGIVLGGLQAATGGGGGGIEILRRRIEGI